MVSGEDRKLTEFWFAFDRFFRSLMALSSISSDVRMNDDSYCTVFDEFAMNGSDPARST